MASLNVPSFRPEDEGCLYIPCSGDELLLTRDWTFRISKYEGINLLNAMGRVETKKNTYTWGEPGHPRSSTYKRRVIQENVPEKLSFTLIAGCILIVDKINRRFIKFRVSYHPKEQGFRGRSFRPSVELSLDEVNNKLFFLPCSEPEVEFGKGMMLDNEDGPGNKKAKKAKK